MPKQTKSRSSSSHLVKELNKIASAKARYKAKMYKLYEENFIKQVIDMDEIWLDTYRRLMVQCNKVVREKFEEYDKKKSELEDGYGISRTYTSRRVRIVSDERQESESDTDSSSADVSD